MTVNYQVDTAGRRTKKTVNGTTTVYFYTGSTMISEKQGSNWTDYIFFGGQRIAQQRSATGPANTTYLHADHLGSTRRCTDGNGNPTGACDYEPFGEFISPAACSALPTNYRFAGMYWDVESQLYHTWFRQYDPNQGRWMGVDPLPGSPHAPQSLDDYVYVLNDPTHLVDRDGLCPLIVAGILQTYPPNGEGAQALVDYAAKIGANLVFPYGGQGFAGSIASIVAQDWGSTNTATQLTQQGINLSRSDPSGTGLTSVITFSGGAQSFVSALPSGVTPTNTFYISPGSGLFTDLRRGRGSQRTEVLRGGGLIEAILGIFAREGGNPQNIH